MNQIGFESPRLDKKKILIGVGLLVVAGVIFYFTSSFVLQAFRGPRTVSESELSRITTSESGNNYISYTPSRPAMDTGLKYGKKNNPGTKYLLIPVGRRALFTSARIKDNGPTYVGRLVEISGSTEKKVLKRLEDKNPGLREHLVPVMLQGVRSIWFDSVIAMAAILGCSLTGLFLAIRGWIPKQDHPDDEWY